MNAGLLHSFGWGTFAYLLPAGFGVEVGPERRVPSSSGSLVCAELGDLLPLVDFRAVSKSLGVTAVYIYCRRAWGVHSADVLRQRAALTCVFLLLALILG